MYFRFVEVLLVLLENISKTDSVTGSKSSKHVLETSKAEMFNHNSYLTVTITSVLVLQSA